MFVLWDEKAVPKDTMHEVLMRVRRICCPTSCRYVYRSVIDRAASAYSRALAWQASNKVIQKTVVKPSTPVTYIHCFKFKYNGIIVVYQYEYVYRQAAGWRRPLGSLNSRYIEKKCKDRQRAEDVHD